MEEMRLPSSKGKQESLKEEREKYLRNLGIILLSREEISRMSYSQFLTYKVEMLNKIHKTKTLLGEEAIEKSKTFNWALNQVSMVNSSAELVRLREELEKDKQEKLLEK